MAANNGGGSGKGVLYILTLNGNGTVKDGMEIDPENLSSDLKDGPLAALANSDNIPNEDRLCRSMAAPGIAVTAIFTFVFSWNEFLFALFLTFDKGSTMPVTLQKTIDLYNVLWGSLSAGAVLQLLPMILVVFLLQRHIARGLALGAVK